MHEYLDHEIRAKLSIIIRQIPTHLSAVERSLMPHTMSMWWANKRRREKPK